MPLPFPQNNTCDIYRFGAASPPAAPSVAGVACLLLASYERREEAGEGDVNNVHFTHVMLVDVSVDIRDAMNNFASGATADTIYVPDKNGTPFLVICVERLGRGTLQDRKRVYLDRKRPTWPTDNL